MRQSKRARPILAVLCVALGIYPLSIALGFVHVGDAQVHAPMWVIALSGIVFLIAGCMILLANRSRANDVLACIVCLLFGVVGMWVALFGASESFSVGMPLLSHDANVKIARGVFGSGAIICFAISGYAFRQTFRSDA